MIARLNMGGPALHVAYLSAGLREHGYETTLVAGSLARGEDSMAFVSEELGVQVERCRGFAATSRRSATSSRSSDSRS